MPEETAPNPTAAPDRITAVASAPANGAAAGALRRHPLIGRSPINHRPWHARWVQPEGLDRYDKYRRRLLLQIGAAVPGEDAPSRAQELLVSSTAHFQTHFSRIFYFSTIINLLAW
jgi:hypothetical protein